MSNPLRSLFEAIKGLDYHERLHKAHEFGRTHADTVELGQWIEDLRKVGTVLEELR